MTRDDVLSMAHDAGFNWPEIASTTIEQRLERFAALVAKHEREACAKVCEAIDEEYKGEDVLATWCAEAIRARGEK